MKNIIKLSIIAFVSLILWSCASDPIYDEKLNKSEFFVSFRTYNQLFPSATMTEGDTTTVEVSVGATKGAAVTVNLEVRLPDVPTEVSKDFEVLDMNNNVIASSNNSTTSFQLTFPDGTGSQLFQFVATDNDIADGSRTFTLAITGNSAGYSIGVGSRGESSTYQITVKDDDIPYQTLGIAQFYDDFVYSGAYVVQVTLEQSMLDNTQYRINFPYTEYVMDATDNLDWMGGNTQKYLNFTMTGDNVTWDSFWYTNLLYQAKDGQYIKAYLPSALSSSLAGDDKKSVVVKDNGENIQYFDLFPYYYIDGTGGFGEYEVILAFPGFDLSDALGIPLLPKE